MRIKPYAILPFLLQGVVWKLLAKPFFLFFGHLQVIGYEKIRQLDAPVIFAPNHSHSIDAILLPLAFPLWSRFSPLFYVAREAKYYSGWRHAVFSLFGDLRLIGAYPIAPQKHDYVLSLDKHISILNDGFNMCIFPEGGTTKDGDIKEAHGGVTHLGLATQKPVVPVLISGTYNINQKKFFSRERHIIIQFLDPILSKDFADAVRDQRDYKSAAQMVTNRLRETREALKIS